MSGKKKSKAKPKARKAEYKAQKPVEAEKQPEPKQETGPKETGVAQATCPGAETKPKAKPVSTAKFIIICAVIALVILGSVFIPRYLKNRNFESNKYNNFEFVKTDDGYWMTVVQKGPQSYQIPFYYHPRDLEDIPVENYLRVKFFDIRDRKGQIYITLDPDSSDNKIVIAGVEIARITGGQYDLLNVATRSAFIKQPANITADIGTPIITCKDANDQTLVIWLTLSDLNIAYSQGNCIILEAKTYDDLVRVADRLMYHLLGIMD